MFSRTQFGRDEHIECRSLQFAELDSGSSDFLDRTQSELLTSKFQKIFTIGMPSRSDKKDAAILAAHLTGIKLDWIDGVDADTMSPKAIPDVNITQVMHRKTLILSS